MQLFCVKVDIAAAHSVCALLPSLLPRPCCRETSQPSAFSPAPLHMLLLCPSRRWEDRSVHTMWSSLRRARRCTGRAEWATTGQPRCWALHACAWLLFDGAHAPCWVPRRARPALLRLLQPSLICVLRAKRPALLLTVLSQVQEDQEAVRGGGQLPDGQLHAPAAHGAGALGGGSLARCRLPRGELRPCCPELGASDAGHWVRSVPKLNLHCQPARCYCPSTHTCDRRMI